MSAIDDGGPAFPIPIAGCNDGGVYNVLEQSGGQYGGMTLRDWFAGQALDLAATLEHAHPTGSEGQPTYAGIATRSYYMADSMLAARKGGAA